MNRCTRPGVPRSQPSAVRPRTWAVVAVAARRSPRRAWRELAVRVASRQDPYGVVELGRDAVELLDEGRSGVATRVELLGHEGEETLDTPAQDDRAAIRRYQRQAPLRIADRVVRAAAAPAACRPCRDSRPPCTPACSKSWVLATQPWASARTSSGAHSLVAHSVASAQSASSASLDTRRRRRSRSCTARRRRTRARRPAHRPLVQRSSSVQGSSSSQAPPSAPSRSQLPRSQAPSVHSEPSSQSSFWAHGMQSGSGAPPTHVPAWQASSGVQPLPSSQLSPSARTCAQVKVTPRSQKSKVQSFESSHSTCEEHGCCACTAVTEAEHEDQHGNGRAEADHPGLYLPAAPAHQAGVLAGARSGTPLRAASASGNVDSTCRGTGSWPPSRHSARSSW